MEPSEEAVESVGPVKRFKHQSYTQSLKKVHLPSTFNQAQYERDIGDNESHFHEALTHWRQLNLSPAFIAFANHVEPLSLSMPMLLHHWKDIIESWEGAMDKTNDEGLKALLDLMQKMAHDLRTTLSPVYPAILKRLLKLLPRSLEPAVLSVLLETLSSLFRYLLVPSVHTELITHSWNAIQLTLPKCLPEIQRTIAEVWGSVLRKLKSASRDLAVTLLATNAKGLEDPSGWAVVYASKSISQTLHTSTIPIFTTLLPFHISAEQTEPTYTILRRSLTALVHHVKDAEHFLVLGDLLVRELKKAAEEHEVVKLERLRRLLEIISIPYSVRQGSRMSPAHHATLFAILDTLPLDQYNQPAMLKFCSALFIASDTSLWLGPGLKFLQRIWSTSADAATIEFAIRLHGILADLGWGGWKLVALPIILKSTRKLDSLAVSPRIILNFLAALCRAKKLGIEDVDLVWKENTERWLLNQLRRWSKDGGDLAAAQLDNILMLSPFMSSEFTSTLIGMIDQELQTTGTVGVSDRGDVLGESTWVLGTSMRALQKRPYAEWSTRADICGWIRSGIRDWGSSPEVLAGLAPLARMSAGMAGSIPLEEIYPNLQTALLSHSRLLRLNALRLMDSNLVVAPGGVQEVLRRCLQGEEVSLDVQGVRERVLRIGRVGQVVGDPIGADLCTRWLLAQLKVNLRPLWSPAAAALASLSRRFGDVVWNLIFAEIQVGSSGARTPHQSQYEPDQDLEETGDEIWEEERSWRDPSAHKLRVILSWWLDPDSRVKELLKETRTGDRFDPLSYEHQLLAALGECHALAEKHNRDIVTHFLSLVSEDATPKLPKQKLSSWLTLFSKFDNPKALYASDKLRALYIAHLSHPDRNIQSLVLSCLFTYKIPQLVNHEEKIRLLLDDTRWRDELTLLEIEDVDSKERRDFVDVIVRLLFGIMLERKGRTRGADRRAAVLTAFAACADDELGLLVDLMLKPLSSHKHAWKDTSFLISTLPPAVTDKQLFGFLTLLGDVLKNLGSRLVTYWPALLGSTIDIINHTQVRLDAMLQGGVNNVGEEDQEEIDNDVDDKEETTVSVTPARVVRSIRQLGLKRFADFFRCPVSFDFTPYLTPAFHSFIVPRLSNLDKENTQAPSTLMGLFYAWTMRSDHVIFLVQYSPNLLPKVYDCLVATNVKPSVIMRVFDITERILAHSSTDERVRDTVLKPHVSRLLDNLVVLVERAKGAAAVADPIGQRQLSILSEIAQYSEDAAQATTLLTLFTPTLRRPSKFVPEKVKVDLLKVLVNMMGLIPELRDKESIVYQKTYETFSQLFQSLRSRASRICLVSAFNQLAALGGIQDLASLLDDMNAYSTRRIDEPDFDRRLGAFARLNENYYQTLSPVDWTPLLYNSLYCIQDATELAIRNNASFTLRHFLDVVASQTSNTFEELFLRLLFPGLKNGLRSKNELVRAEILGVVASAVSKCDFIAPLKEMQVLLEGGDEEASFFNNILHIQLHRRSRALRRLGDHCDEGHLRSSTLADVFIPLVGNFVASTSTIDHHLVNDAIIATGRMAKHLNWSAYYTLVQRYIKLSKTKDESERVYVRTIVAILESFHFPMNEAVAESGKKDEEAESDTEDQLNEPGAIPATTSAQLSRIADAVNLRLLPSLLDYLEKHDAKTDDNTRIPVSIGIVTVAKHLPESTREPQIARLLTILSQILRSRSQDTRDIARDAIVRISVSLGPKYLPLVLRELRGALMRGPQLHVLAFVAHAILVQVTSQDHAATFDLLDDCVGDVAYVSAEVIFGESGKDVLSEDFKTKMREVRGSSSRGLDSFNLIAKVISPNKISSLLAPLRAIVQETESSRVMHLVDEVLKRVASGLHNNKHLVPGELIVLCHTLISQNAKFLKQSTPRRKNAPKNDVIVQMKRDLAPDSDHYANNSFRFVSFGLELFNTALRRSRFDFHDTEIIKRLESMVVVIGNTLYSTNAPVVMLGLKCAASLTKCPLKNLPKSVPVFVSQMIDIIRQTGNTESEIVQVAFKSLATILRDFPGVQVKEKDLIFLLELLSPDLEEHERQAAVFTMLRAIVARKFVVPEIYDIMDKVGEILVTNQSPQVQELCRGILLQFLLDYPQGKGRLRNQMAFFAKNLSYVYESGRKSVMELLGAIIIKFQEALIHEYTDLLFVALVMVIANDDSAKCREMAAQLIKNLYARLDEDRQKFIFSHLHTWAVQEAQTQLIWVSSQIYGFIIDAAQQDIRPYISMVLDDLRAALANSSSALSSKGDDDEDGAMEVDVEWKISYHSLTVLFKALQVFPDLCIDDVKVPWNLVALHLLYPHAWVRTAACRLIGLLFAALPVAPPRIDVSEDHFASLAGMRDLTAKLCSQLKSENLDETLSLQIVKNLFFLGKCFYVMPNNSNGSEPASGFPDNGTGERDTEEDVTPLHDPLPWLFSKLSYQIKSAHIARRNRTASPPRWHLQPLAALRWFAAMVSHIDADNAERFLVHVLTPVHRLTEDDTIRDAQMEELKTTAIELQDLVQAKVGTTKFSTAYNQIRQKTLDLRRNRKADRVLQATINPGAAAKRKLQRNVIKKESRKRKDRSFAESRGKLKRQKSE